LAAIAVSTANLFLCTKGNWAGKEVKWLLLLVQRHNRSTEWMRNWVEDNADVTSELSVVKKSVFF
jgi:hypothetical protein